MRELVILNHKAREITQTHPKSSICSQNTPPTPPKNQTWCISLKLADLIRDNFRTILKYCTGNNSNTRKILHLLPKSSTYTPKNHTRCISLKLADLIRDNFRTILKYCTGNNSNTPKILHLHPQKSHSVYFSKIGGLDSR